MKKAQGKAVYIAVMILLIAAVVCLCGCMSKKAAHIDYADDSSVQYGTGNYLYSTVTFTGKGLGSEKIRSVKDIEEAAYDNDKIGYSGKYSMMTSGSVFSIHKYTGVKLYKYLISIGMSKELDESTPVTVVSADGYTKVLTIRDIKENKYNCYDSKSAAKAKEKNVPVLLAFGSDKKPLVGPTGSQSPGTKISKKDGYDKDADNIGGPLRLIIGQRSASEYNAPGNSKWVTQVIIGKKADYTAHKAKTASRKVLRLAVYDRDDGNKKTDSVSCSLGSIEKFAAAKQKNMERSYYGARHFYEGADLWGYIKLKTKLASQEGQVKFSFKDGSSLTLDLEYLRDLSGSRNDYTTTKGGRKITSVMPALAYSADGAPTAGGKVYALLPAKKGVKKTTSIRECTAIDIYAGRALSRNPNAAETIKISGRGIKNGKAYTVGKLENMPDITKTVGKYSGVSLYDLLNDAGLTVDADTVTVKSGSDSVKMQLKKIKKGNYILATRRGGSALANGEGAVSLKGDAALKNVRSISVGIRRGQWTHSRGVFRKYLDTGITISGSAAAKKKTYTLAELEKLGSGYTVRDSFASSAGSSGYQGVILRKLIKDDLKKGLKKPSAITITGKDAYSKRLSVADVFNGIESRYQQGESRDIILAYSIDGSPLVPAKKSAGYDGTNAFGPVRLIIENQISGWVKNVEKIEIDK